MYQSYHSYGRGKGANMGSRVRERIRDVVIILLLIAVIALAVAGVPAIRYRESAQQTFAARMQTECSEAQAQVVLLSRTAGSNSSAILAKIRSSVYAISVINQTANGLAGGGNYLVDVQLLEQLFSTMDAYMNKLVTGISTSEQQTQLSEGLQMLAQQLEQIAQ